jgi:hypothetical protein
MIDIESEKLVSFSDARKLIPGGRRVDLSQIYRWAQRGLRGLKLEWAQIGGRRYTSREALGRFFARLTQAAGGEATVAPIKVRANQIEKAERDLVAAGFEVGGTKH